MKSQSECVKRATRRAAEKAQHRAERHTMTNGVKNRRERRGQTKPRG